MFLTNYLHLHGSWSGSGQLCRPHGFLNQKMKWNNALYSQKLRQKTTQYNTKWARKNFENWQQNWSNKNPQVESVCYEDVNWSQVENLNIRLLTAWIFGFLNLLVKLQSRQANAFRQRLCICWCCINRHFLDVKDSFNILAN